MSNTVEDIMVMLTTGLRRVHEAVRMTPEGANFSDELFDDLYRTACRREGEKLCPCCGQIQVGE